MPKAKVVFIGELQPRRLQIFVEGAPEEFSVVTLPQTASPDEMIREVKDADFLIPHLGRRRLPDEVCRAGKQLKLIQLTGSGYDSLPLPLLHELGVRTVEIRPDPQIPVLSAWLWSPEIFFSDQARQLEVSAGAHLRKGLT